MQSIPAGLCIINGVCGWMGVYAEDGEIVDEVIPPRLQGKHVV